MENINRVVAANLARLRQVSGYSQERVAFVLGLSYKEYCKYEKLKEEVPYNTLERIADFYGCNLINFFDEAVNETTIPFPACPEGMTNEDVDEINRFHDIVKSYLKMIEIEKL